MSKRKIGRRGRHTLKRINIHPRKGYPAELLTYSAAQKNVAACKERGDVYQATYLLEQIVAALPDDISSKVDLLELHITDEMWTKAKAVADSIKIDVCFDAVHARSIGRAYSQLGNSVTAAEFFNKSLKLQPSNSATYNDQGNCYRYAGDIVMAQKAYLTAIRINGSNSHALLNHASLVKGKLKETDLLNMKELATNDSLTRQQSARINFAIAWGYTDRNIDLQFQHLNIANSLMDEMFTHHPNWSTEGAQSVIENCNSNVFDALFNHGSSSEQPIFVLGMPRSGTTLVEQIVASHSSVVSCGETGAFPGAMRDIITEHNYRQPYWDWNKTKASQWLNYLANAYTERMATFNIDGRKFVDKTINNIEFLGIILHAFPNAKIVYCQRNPLDICLSCYQSYFPQGHEYSFNLEQLAKKCLSVEALMKHWHTQAPNQILFLQYEDLVKNQQTTTEKLLEFCDLNWEEQCLAFYETSKIVKTASAEQVRQPIYKGSVDRWKAYKNHLKPAADILGYIV